jgi:undecaprenyl-diphosphatase
MLVWQLDAARRGKVVVPLIIAVVVATGIATLIKRLVSRVRPGRENAGKFLGPFWSHANFRESFPSSHSASAVALSVMLAILYPPAAPTFWALALACAALRYLMDAHWPSDVLAGIALGYVSAYVTAHLFHIA